MKKVRKMQKAMTTRRPKRIMLSAKGSLKRMGDFERRKAEFIATVRKGQNRPSLADS